MVIMVAHSAGKAISGRVWREAFKEALQLELGPPVALSGVVQDKEGKPVANALVRLTSAFKNDPDNVERSNGLITDEGPEWELFSTRTDAAGQWTLDSLPAGWTVSYELLDDRYVRQAGRTELPLTGTKAAKALIARPGAVVIGRVVDSTGKSVAGAKVSARSSLVDFVSDHTVTDADGNYRMARLGSGDCRITVQQKADALLVVAPIAALRIKEGETTKAPDMLLVPGALVQGRVTDARTGAPLKDVSISVPGNTTRTGPDGNYSVRAVPGSGRISIQGKTPGYVTRPWDFVNTTTVTLTEGGTHTKPFALEPVVPLTGVALSEDGQPVVGATIVAGRTWEDNRATSGEGGVFTFNNLAQGEVALTGGKGWEIINPAPVTLPLKAPLTLRLRRLVTAPLSGLVVDKDGAPVAVAQVQIEETIMVDERSTSATTDNTTTNAEGRWTWVPSRGDSTFKVTASKEGYRFDSGGRVASPRQVMLVNGTMAVDTRSAREISDIVLLKLDAHLAGRAVDEQGAPIAGATVRAYTSKTLTDANGMWQIADIPAGEVPIRAAKGNLFIATSATAVKATAAKTAGLNERAETAKDVILTLKPVKSVPPEPVAARAVIDNLLAQNDNSTSFTLLPLLARTDLDAALLLMAKINPRYRSTVTALALSSFFINDPERARERLPALLAALPEPLTGSTAVELALEMAGVLPEEARAIFDRETAKLTPLDVTKSHLIRERMLLAALAARLGLVEQANALLDSAIEAQMTLNAKPVEWKQMNGTIDTVAKGGAALFERALAKVPAKDKAKELTSAIPTLARFDLAEARRLFDAIPGLLPPQGADSTQEWNYGRAVLAIIGRVGETNPAEALAMARRVTNEQTRGKALALAATWQPADERLKLLREAFLMRGESMDWSQSLPIVRHASNIIPELGETMALELEEIMEAQSGRYGMFNRYGFPELTSILGRTRPGYARLLLEQEWEQRLGGDSWERREVVLAMIAIDWSRALEMADALQTTDANGKVQDNERLDVIGSIIRWAQAPEKLRSAVSVSRISQLGSEHTYFME
jgi:hypothetical protein